MAVLLSDICTALRDAGFSVGVFADLEKKVKRQHILHGTESTPAKDAVNLCSLEELTALGAEVRRGCCFLCASSSDAAVAQLFGAEVLTVSGPGAMPAAANVISRVFAEDSFITETTSKIFSSLSDTFALKAILNTAGSALGVQMVLGDTSHTVLTHNVPDIPPEEKDWDCFVGRGIAPSFNSASGCRVYDRITLDSGVRLSLCHNPALGVHNAICDIISGGRAEACLSILINGGTLSRTEREIISAMCEALRIEMDRHARPDVVRALSYEGFLISLLESRITNPEHIHVLASKLNMSAEGFFAVFAIDFGSSRGEGTALPMRELLEGIEAALGDSRAVNHDGKIIVLVDFRDKEGFSAQDYTVLREYIAAYGMRCGMSRPFHRLHDTHMHYIEALDCVEVGKYTAFMKHDLLGAGINYYERCEPFVLIHEAAEHGVDLHKFVHPFAVTLNDYDREHDTEYLRTLFEYIRIPKKPQAAEALFIHRNTLDYRLKKIRELVDFSWDDGETLSRLFLSICIIFYIRARHDYNENRGVQPQV